MIELDLYLFFVGTCIMFGLIPGPNIALIVANSVAYGTRYGLVSVAGTSSAMVPQLAITVLGATTLLTLVAFAFEWLRWLGVAYLIYLGARHWFAETDDNLEMEADKKAKALKKSIGVGFGYPRQTPRHFLFLVRFFLSLFLRKVM